MPCGDDGRNFWVSGQTSIVELRTRGGPSSKNGVAPSSRQPQRNTRTNAPSNGKLKSTRHDSRYRKVLVEFFPAQGSAVEFERHLAKLCVRGCFQNSEATSREPDDSTVRQFQKHHATFDPNPHRGGFHIILVTRGRGSHETSPRVAVGAEKPNVQFREGRAASPLLFAKAARVPARTCTRRLPCGHGYAPVPDLHRNRSENEKIQREERWALVRDGGWFSACRLRQPAARQYTTFIERLRVGSV